MSSTPFEDFDGDAEFEFPGNGLEYWPPDGSEHERRLRKTMTKSANNSGSGVQVLKTRIDGGENMGKRRAMIVANLLCE